MELIDIIIVGAIALIVGGAIAYIIWHKKRGGKCIGCPKSTSCQSNNSCGGCGSCDCNK